MLLIAKLIDYYSVVVIVAVILSWLQLPPSNQVVRITRMLTEPALAPIRRLVPSAGGIDFSPLILLVLLQILKSRAILWAGRHHADDHLVESEWCFRHQVLVR